MSYDAGKIVNVQTTIKAKGLSTANFGSAMLFVPKTDGNKGSLQENAYYTYSSIEEVAEAFAPETEAYKACQAWLGGTPNIKEIHVWVRDPLDSSWDDTLNKARNKTWWYWTFATKVAYEQAEDVKAIAKWCETAGSMFVNCQTGASATSIRDSGESSDIASELTKLGYRHCFTSVHATDAYSGIYLAKHFAVVNYSGKDTTITGNFKKSPGLSAEDLTSSEESAMMLPTKKACFYTIVDLQGSYDMGRWLNTYTHSSYGEFIDDVVNIDAFVNFATVAVYNMLTGAKKIPQTPVGQALLNSAVAKVGEQFVRNGFLGERKYLDNNAEEQISRGYEIITLPTDILDISDADRSARKSAPIQLRIFPAGAIHTVNIEVNVE